jgi:hypothetical protein
VRVNRTQEKRARLDGGDGRRDKGAQIGMAFGQCS